jgi:IS5 family transposase
VLRLTGGLADLAQQAINDASAVLDNAGRALRRVAGRQRGRLHRAINELSTMVIRGSRIVAQGRRRVAGERIESATRLVSLHDPDARPIVKGRLGKPVEFATRPGSSTTKTAWSSTTTSKTGNPRRRRATRPGDPAPR